MTDTDHELEAAIADAKASFDLGDLLNKRSFGTKVVTIFTDEETALELGGVYPSFNMWGQPDGVERKGVLGEIFELRIARKEAIEKGEEFDDTELEGLLTKAEKLTEALEQSALKVKIRSIPEDVKKQATRKAKTALGIKGKPAEDQQEEFDAKETAYLVARSLVSITTADGAERTRFSHEDAEQLRGKLPTGEFPKIHKAVMQLSYRAVVAEQYTLGDPDFSPAG